VLSDWGHETLLQIERLFTSPMMLVATAGYKVTAAMSQNFYLSVSKQRKGSEAAGVIARLIRGWRH